MDPTETIFNLLNDGHVLASRVEAETNVRAAERLARQANGYFVAAATLLAAFGELHNAMIDHPLFVAARRFQRRYTF